jgi:hypothetical protein
MPEDVFALLHVLPFFTPLDMNPTYVIFLENPRRQLQSTGVVNTQKPLQVYCCKAVLRLT